MKNLEGKKVWLRPTGNNARRTATGNQKEEATIVKVARVFITIKLGDSTYEQKLRIHEYHKNTINSDYNSGYVVYATEQELDEYYEAKILARLIQEKFEYGNKPENCSIDDLRKIGYILNIVRSKL
jgi:hypothetical protein